ncbi:uncharacterized protein LOC142358091 [Convolutriloba macropyga]|uniref:uncharacterized protein LOC142358091 n=1 Tax=Convolutriloba macropyga TaxID=536237 RepID=UPI003F528CE6
MPGNAGMVFGADVDAAAAKRAAEAQRKAAYRAELEQQMQAAASRKAAQKQAEKDFDARQEREAGLMWGNARGGGGDPLRDDAGNAISDLNQVRHLKNKPSFNAAPAGPPPAYEAALPPSNNPRAPPSMPQGPPQAGVAAPSSQQPIGNFRSDNAYMLPSEIDARQNARRKMQEELQEQIEQKRLAKEQEKQREKDEERKEMERLQREQEELRAAYEAEAIDKKAKAAEEAENMRKLAEEAYIKAQARKASRRSDTGSQGGDDDGPPFHDDDRDGVGEPQPSAQPKPRGRRPSSGGGYGKPMAAAGRPPSSRSGRTAVEIARLKEEIGLQTLQMQVSVEQQMREAALRQEEQMRDLKKRADAAEAEVADIKKVVKRSASYGRRASPDLGQHGQRRRWGDRDNGWQQPLAAPSESQDYFEFGESISGRYNSAPRQPRRSDPAGASINLNMSLAGDSRLIFPGDTFRPISQQNSEVSLSRMKPLPLNKRPASGGRGIPPPSPLIAHRSQSAGQRPRSRLGTPVDVDGLLAKNVDRSKLLDEYNERAQFQEDDSGVIGSNNSDSLDDLLQKFVELERPPAGPLATAKRFSEMSMSMAGESEWI